MAYVLRHRPDSLGLSLDEEGWTDLAALAAGLEVSEEQVLQVVATDRKGRYAARDGRIRANQGHSVKLSLEFERSEPPARLYHGTTRERWERIRESGGLSPMRRHHVHLSPDVQTARQVGARHRAEELLVLEVDAAGMAAAGHPFWISENGVWLVSAVPLEFLHG